MIVSSDQESVFRLVFEKKVIIILLYTMSKVKKVISEGKMPLNAVSPNEMA